MLLGDVLAFAAMSSPERRAVVAPDRTLTFAELRVTVNRLTNALGTLARPGARVAILATNVPEYAEAFYAVPSAGMILTLLNYRLNPREWAYILANAEVSVLLVEDRFLDAVEPVLVEIPSLEHVVVIGDGARSGMLAYADLVGTASPAPPEVSGVSPDDTACLIYTSGTTGFPKGAMVSHRNIVAAATMFGYELGLGIHERFLQTFPMCHASGFQLFLFHLRAAEVHLTPMFTPDSFLELVEARRITYTSLAPTMAAFVLQHPNWADADLSSVKTLMYGGMAMPAEFARPLADRVGGLTTGFGQSETTLLVTFGDHAFHRRALSGEEHLLASCGRAMVLAGVKVLDDDMRECEPGEVGELCVRGPSVMSGYWANEEGTREAFAGGWLHTGDLARRDEEGFFYIVDRKKDMLKTGGQNVYPREVEQVIATHPAVQEVAVIGLPDPVWGDNVVAVVVLREDATVGADELTALCASRLAGYKKPKQVLFVDELPKNVTGKVQKRELRDRLVRGG